MCCGKMIRLPKRKPVPLTKEEIEIKAKDDAEKTKIRMANAKRKLNRMG